MTESIDIIKEIEKNIFAFNFKDFDKLLGSLGDRLAREAVNFDKSQIDLLNEILKLVNIAINNKDYLFLADILEYELTPLINKNSGCGGN